MVIQNLWTMKRREEEKAGNAEMIDKSTESQHSENDTNELNETPGNLFSLDGNKTPNFNFEQYGNAAKFEHFIDLKDASVKECINMYLINRSNRIKDPQRQYSEVLYHLNAIEKNYNITLKPIVIGDVFWNTFHSYLQYKGLAQTTINNICCKIAAVLKWSAKYGARISPTLDDCYTTEAAAKPKISLSWDDVSRITYFDIEKELMGKHHRKNYIQTLKRVRDQFVLSCFIGQRYSDVNRIKPENFKDDVFRITQQKTGNKAVVDFKKLNTYPKVIKGILERYNYKPPYGGDISNYNKKLHELFKLAGFTEDVPYEWKVNGVLHKKVFKRYQLISSHTARRTMITNNVEAGINPELVRRASGHKSENAFSKYIVWNDD